RGDARPRRGPVAPRRPRHVDRHLPRPVPPPAAPALAGGEAAGGLPGAGFGRPAAPGQARGAAAGARRRALRAWAGRLVARYPEGRRPAPATPAARTR